MDIKDNHNKEIRKRIWAILLSLVVAVTMMPVFAFADDTAAQGARNENAASSEDTAGTQIVDADLSAEEIGSQDNAGAEDAVQTGTEEVQPQTGMIVPESEAVRLTGETDDEEPLQFLCDHTDFTSSIVECYSVSGRLDKNYSYTGTVSGKSANHMWNIIRMNDGRYYMADITNCDGESSFSPDMLFLRGSSTVSTPSAGYRFNGKNGNYLYYRYDADTISMFSYELELAASDYSTDTAADEEKLAEDIRRQSDERSAG